MSFLSPFFLFALIAVGLPLLIHLINLRKPKKYQFSTLQFFSELQKTTFKNIKVKKLLLLFLRLAAIACLALVLARPFLPPGLGMEADVSEPTAIAIVIDNSISMGRTGADGPLLEQGKRIAETIKSSAKSEDRFVLQKAAGESLVQSFLTSNQLESRIEELEIEKAGSFLSQRINGLSEFLDQSPYAAKKIFVITDSQFESDEDLLNSLDQLPESIAISLIKIEEVPVQNTYVSGLSTSSSMIGNSIPFQLNVSLSNGAEVPIANQFVTVEFENSVVGQFPVSLAAGETQGYSFTLIPQKTGSVTGKISIEGDEFVLDNEYFFSLRVPEKRKILWVHDRLASESTISYTELILTASNSESEQIEYTEITTNNLTASVINEFDAVLLDGVQNLPEYMYQPLQRFVQDGNGLILFPSQQANISSYNNFLDPFNIGRYVGVIGDYGSFNSIAKGTVLLDEHPIFDGLFERTEEEKINFTSPDLYYYYKWASTTSALGFNLITMNNGDVLVREKEFGDGRIIISTIGNNPSWSNFPINPLFAPFIYRSILYAASSEAGGFENHNLGRVFNWTGDLDSENVRLLVNEESIQVGTTMLNSGVQLSYGSEEWTPGWIKITDSNLELSVATNLPIQESIFEQNAGMSEEISELNNVRVVETASLDTENLDNEIRWSGFGKEIWRWFMIAGFLFLVAESLVSIYYKAETIQ